MGYGGKVVFEIDADTKGFDSQIESVKQELDGLLKRYEETQNMKPFEGQEEDLKQLELEIEKTNNKLVGLKNQQAKLGQESVKSTSMMSKGFEKGLKSVKKLALGIIGVRSAFMLARRAASAYMSQDEELSKKMQQTWVGLGSFLEPVLTKLTDLMLKFVGYLNEFIKALTGEDYIARANAKALEKQAKAQEKLNKETEKYQNYDFDVIRTQQIQTASESSTKNDEANTIDIPELNEKIVKKLQDLAKWLKENKELIEAVGIALGITFGAVTIGKLLTNIGLLIGSATTGGLAGLLAILSLIAVAWVIKVFIDGKKDVDDMWKKVNDMYSKGIIKNQEIHEQKLESPESVEAKNYAEKIQGILGLKDRLDKIAKLSSSIEKSKKEHPILAMLGWYKGDEQALNNLKKELNQHIEQLLDLADANLLNEDGLEELVYILNNYDKLAGDVYIEETRLEKAYRNSYTSIIKETNALKNLTTEYEDLLIKFKQSHPGIDLNTEDARKEFENFVKEINGELPEQISMKVNVDTTQATQKLFSLKDSVLNWLPNKKTVTVEVKGDASKLATVLDTIAAAMEVIQPGAMGYSIASGLRYNANMLKNYSAFATGGYVSQPTLALVGEGRSKGEYMIPDGEDYISRLASEIGQYSGGEHITNVYLDGRLIQRQVDNTRNRINFTKNR